MTFPSWTREPLVHFLALGAILYVVLTWGETPVDPASRIITVDAETKAQLALGFEQAMGRAPTDAELDARIARHVRDEVLYREALRLGLDQGDAIVRQRMVSKMDLAASAAAEVAEPGEEVLRAWFEQNRDRYSSGQTTSFEQRVFKSESEAKAALGKAGEPGQGAALSLPGEMTSVPMREVEARFGLQFARGLADLAPDGQWRGPIPSGFGWHIVRVHQRKRAEAEFDAVAARVANDWRSEQIEQRRERAYEILRSAYRVEVD